jgi:hypothetical protein
MTRSKKKDITVLNTDPSSTTIIETILGALSVSAFIIIWIASCASPVILYLSIKYSYHYITTFIVVCTIAAYTPWEEHGFISRALQNFLNKYHPLYYNGVTLIFEDGDVKLGASSKEKDDDQTFYSVHPHGAFCIGWAILYHNPVMRGIRFCFAPSLYASPMFRLFSRAVNKPGSAARHCMNTYLRNGESCALPPGGFEEATLTSTAVDRVFIKKRYGFVKLCLIHGIQIRPVYCFGEGKLFSNIPGCLKTRLKLNRYGIPTILTWGSVFFPLLPKRGVKLYIVVGRPLVLPKIVHPTKEEVNLWHGKYISELQRIYDEHKLDAYGTVKGKNAKLEVW